MSFMPSPGTRVRMRDGRIAVVTKVTPDGEDDRVRYADGPEEQVTPWDIGEVLDDEPDQKPAVQTMSDQKLKFGALARGEHFIYWPVSGDNAGHGGYLGAQRLFVKTGELTANSGSGIESSMNAKTDVIKVVLR